MNTEAVRTDVEALVHQHLPLVGHIVRETMGRVPSYVNRDDLTSAGLFALFQAAQAYDEERGVPFPRYASTRIRGAVLDELRSIDWASRSVRRRARDLDATRSQLATSLGRKPTDEEVARTAGMTLDEIAANDDDVARAQVLSLQASEDALADHLVSKTPDPAAMALHGEQLTYLMEAIAELPERMRIVVEQYFLAERPMAETAAQLGVSESRISQIRAEALVLLREAMHRALEPELVAPHPRPEGCAARRREAYVDSVLARHAAGLRRSMPLSLDETA
ncbi:sigma-70 family RNA polymerase sigma factor [Nocardioides ferulae]|uniref:sigma-70 family RNA polymerase sigma factor n=1 Tax=Nocardioides ferulae TaxID=2340821 RepID=UPI001F0BED4A|nr:FliA/WhiG family RNA polymerase sigma factor [Nocardioides ferulae]